MATSYLIHRDYKYIDKYKSKSGRWVYVYPNNKIQGKIIGKANRDVFVPSNKGFVGQPSNSNHGTVVGQLGNSGHGKIVGSITDSKKNRLHTSVKTPNPNDVLDKQDHKTLLQPEGSMTRQAQDEYSKSTKGNYEPSYDSRSFLTKLKDYSKSKINKGIKWVKEKLGI